MHSWVKLVSLQPRQNGDPIGSPNFEKRRNVTGQHWIAARRKITRGTIPPQTVRVWSSKWRLPPGGRSLPTPSRSFPKRCELRATRPPHAQTTARAAACATTAYASASRAESASTAPTLAVPMAVVTAAPAWAARAHAARRTAAPIARSAPALTAAWAAAPATMASASATAASPVLRACKRCARSIAPATARVRCRGANRSRCRRHGRPCASAMLATLASTAL